MTGAGASRFGQELDRTSTADLAVIVLGEPGGDDREALLERVRRAAALPPSHEAAIELARREVAELLFVRLNRAGLVVTWAGLPWSGASALRADDRVRLVRAAQDAALAEVLGDRLSSDDRDALRAGWELASAMPGLGFGGPPIVRGPLGVGAVIVLAAAVLATGALPLLVILAAQGRRRPDDDA